MEQYNTFNEFFNLLHLIIPYESNYDLVRLGRDEDCGYVVPLLIVQTANELVTCGVGYNISFEQDFRNYNKNAIISCYDGTINELPSNTDNTINFYKKNIGIYTTDNEVCLEDIVTKKHTLLKLDIEGWEVPTLLNAKFNLFDNVDCLVMELHTNVYKINDFITIQHINNLLYKINTYFTLVHLHIPNCMSYYIENNDLGLFEVSGYELTFINKKLIGNNVKPIKLELPINGLDKRSFLAEDQNYDYHSIYDDDLKIMKTYMVYDE